LDRFGMWGVTIHKLIRHVTGELDWRKKKQSRVT